MTDYRYRIQVENEYTYRLTGSEETVKKSGVQSLTY